MTGDHVAPPGWYGDPTAPPGWAERYWDGAQWGSSIRPPTVTHEPLVPQPLAHPGAYDEPQRSEAPPTFPAAGIWFGLLGWGAAIAWPRVVELVLSIVGRGGAATWTAILYVGLFGLMGLAVAGAVKTLGSGSVRADVGLGIARSDIGWAFIALIGGEMARTVVGSLFISVGDTDKYVDTVKSFQRGGTLLAVFVLSLLIGAPLFEELLFRGLLLRSLTGRIGFRLALVTQALLFGVYHFNAAFGWFNVTLCLGNAALGYVFGLISTRQRRLAAGMLAHAAANALALAASFAAS